MKPNTKSHTSGQYPNMGVRLCEYPLSLKVSRHFDWMLLPDSNLTEEQLDYILLDPAEVFHC